MPADDQPPRFVVRRRELELRVEFQAALEGDHFKRSAHHRVGVIFQDVGAVEWTSRAVARRARRTSASAWLRRMWERAGKNVLNTGLPACFLSSTCEFLLELIQR